MLTIKYKIETHKRFRIMLFIRTKHNMHIFGVIPLVFLSTLYQSFLFQIFIKYKTLDCDQCAQCKFNHEER